MPQVSMFPPIANIWPYLCLVAVFEGLAVYLYQFRKIPGTMPLFFNQVCKGLLVLSRVLCGVSPALTAKLFWASFSQWTLLLLVPLWFEFILSVSQQKEKIPAVVRAGIWVFVAFLLLILLSDSCLGWYWGPISLNGQVLRLTFGPGTWAVMVFSYLLVLVCLGISVQWILSVRGIRRRQAVMLSITPMFTLLGNVLGRVPALQIFSPQLAGLMLSGIYVTWVFYRWRIYSVMPLAHDAVTRTMIDGLLVVDEKGYIVDMNPTARNMFSGTAVTAGGAFEDVAVAWPALAGFGDIPETREFPVGRNYFQVGMTPLVTTGNHLRGRSLS